MPSAKGMATLLRQLSNMLSQYDVIESDALYAFNKVTQALSSQGVSFDWAYSIDKSNPITFRPTSTRRFAHVSPRVFVKVEVANVSQPFRELNSTLELMNEDGNLLTRWHVDLADPGQTGPQFHLQAGGHAAVSEASSYLSIEVPRWAYPPTELILMCELVLANFYTSKWEAIRSETTWCQVVREAERLCYGAYQAHIKNCLAVSGGSKTLLHNLWVS